jgi:ArsR family transcriptional regulator
MDNKYIESARVFKAFCDENRLMILEMLQEGEKCACVLLEKMKIVQSTLSHHMKILVDSGIVSARKEGKWTYYSISGEGVDIAKGLLIKLTHILENCDCCNSQCK